MNLPSSWITSHLNKVPIKIQSLSLLIGFGSDRQPNASVFSGFSSAAFLDKSTKFSRKLGTEFLPNCHGTQQYFDNLRMTLLGRLENSPWEIIAFVIHAFDNRREHVNEIEVTRTQGHKRIYFQDFLRQLMNFLNSAGRSRTKAE